MQFLDLTLPTPAENVALDEALLLAAEEGDAGEILRLWEVENPAVILGTGCRLADDVLETACRTDGVPILRRTSGGGTVLLGAGCLCFSLVLAYERAPELGEVRSSYRCILERIRDSLQEEARNIELAGMTDLAIAGRKFSGNSQQRKRLFLLHHGTVLYAFDIERVGRYLKLPSRQPDYRAGREHSAFLVNLPVCLVRLKKCLCIAWEAREELRAWPTEKTKELTQGKYTQREWTARR
jgi:lipoate-protein ligase A